MESSVFDGEGSLDRVISDKEVEDEHAVQDWEDFPGWTKRVRSIVISQYEGTCYRRQSSILASDCSPGALVPAGGNNISYET